MPAPAHPAARRLQVQRIALTGAAAPETVLQATAVERPVNIVYGSLPYAVMMASPVDLEDFAIGFSLTEGIVSRAEEIRSIAITPQDDGVVVDVELVPERFRAHLAQSRRRNLTGRTSCGLCGVETIDSLPLADQAVQAAVPIRSQAIAAGLDALRDLQVLHSLTHAAHAAAWCDSDGRIVALREDVGRHNALDKLIGARLRAGDTRQGFVLVTSRASFEMVEKAAIFGASTLVAISAPTTLAVERAQCLGLTLVAQARRGEAFVYAGHIDAGQ